MSVATIRVKIRLRRERPPLALLDTTATAANRRWSRSRCPCEPLLQLVRVNQAGNGRARLRAPVRILGYGALCLLLASDGDIPLVQVDHGTGESTRERVVAIGPATATASGHRVARIVRVRHACVHGGVATAIPVPHQVGHFLLSSLGAR